MNEINDICSVRLVRLDEKLIPQVARLEAECFSSPWSESSLGMLTGERGVGFCLLAGDTVAAYGGMLTVLDEGQITNIAVSAEYRRRGFGREIVKALIDYARQGGISFVTLEVRESNRAARALYDSEGFRETGVRKNFYSLPTENGVLMEKEL